MATDTKPPFTTWTYDKPCPSMTWNDLVPASLSVDTNEATVETVTAADLILLGVRAPAVASSNEDEDEDEVENNESDESPVVELSGIVQAVDESYQGALTALLSENHKEFKHGAKLGSTTPTLRMPSARRCILVGLGTTPSSSSSSLEETDQDPWQGAGTVWGKTVAAKCQAEKKVRTCHVIVPAVLAHNATFLRDFATAFYGELYVDHRFKTGPRSKKVAPDLRSVVIVASDATESAVETQSAIEAGKHLARGIFLTKDIVNAPHNVLNSLSLAETAKRIAKESGGTLTCVILDRKECEKRGMGAFLGVARGSETEPQFIHLTYKSSGKINKKVGIVGKGLLFDTGGYNIKSQTMELMKFDCGGAAAALGAARAVAALQPPGVEAHFFVAACENMINEKAYVPSDILTAANGKTIEVLNTDAEGRLTLADALVFADKEAKCEEIIELSTLTGACMVALGKQVAGMWTANDNLASELADISKLTGEKVWRMPLEKGYIEDFESKFADMKNIGSRYGGAIIAALFLQKFVSSKKPFAHIDIAGPVWSDKNGATGFGTKLVVEWVRRSGITSD